MAVTWSALLLHVREFPVLNICPKPDTVTQLSVICLISLYIDTSCRFGTVTVCETAAVDVTCHNKTSKLGLLMLLRCLTRYVRFPGVGLIPFGKGTINPGTNTRMVPQVISLPLPERPFLFIVCSTNRKRRYINH
jgi:hypothetical protein